MVWEVPLWKIISFNTFVNGIFVNFLDFNHILFHFSIFFQVGFLEGATASPTPRPLHKPLILGCGTTSMTKPKYNWQYNYYNEFLFFTKVYDKALFTLTATHHRHWCVHVCVTQKNARIAFWCPESVSDTGTCRNALHNTKSGVWSECGITTSLGRCLLTSRDQW